MTSARSPDVVAEWIGKFACVAAGIGIALVPQMARTGAAQAGRAWLKCRRAGPDRRVVAITAPGDSRAKSLQDVIRLAKQARTSTWRLWRCRQRGRDVGGKVHRGRETAVGHEHGRHEACVATGEPQDRGANLIRAARSCQIGCPAGRHLRRRSTAVASADSSPGLFY